MVCERCGMENPGDFRFCGRCGAPLERAREVRKTVTVLFCDLTGSTAMGERLDPEAVRATMRRYYEESRQVLERHGGTVEKFIGDAVMAVFGVPQAHEDDALRAVRAAAELAEDEAAGWIDVARRPEPASDIATLAGVDYVEAIVLARRGELDAAHELAERALLQAEKSDFWDLRAGSREAAAEVMQRSGRPADARRLLEDARAIYDEKGVTVRVARLDALLAEL